MKLISSALVTMFAAGIACGGAGYRAINGPGAEYSSRYTSQDRRDLNSVVRAINLEAKRKKAKPI